MYLIMKIIVSVIAIVAMFGFNEVQQGKFDSEKWFQLGSLFHTNNVWAHF